MRFALVAERSLSFEFIADAEYDCGIDRLPIRCRQTFTRIPCSALRRVASLRRERTCRPTPRVPGGTACRGDGESVQPKGRPMRGWTVTVKRQMGKRTAQYNSAVDSCNQCRTHWRNARMIACCFAMRPLWNADEIMPLKSMAADAIVLKRPYQFCQ